MKRSGANRPAGWWLAALCLLAAAVQAQPLTPQEEAGKKVYLEGVSPSGKPLKAFLGAQETPVEGATLPCGNCHGADGQGRPEGVVRPSDITWSQLIRSYGHRHDNGRTHGPYDEKSFAESLTYGTDPAGQRLDPAMPRYLMAMEDMASLVAYLKRIQSDLDPGLTADRVRIGTLLPRSGRLAEVGQAMEAVLRAQIEVLNARGGLVGRKIDLVVAEYTEDRATGLKNAEELFAASQVFAVVSPMTSGLERETAALAERLKVPVVGPFTMRTQAGMDVNRYTFFVLPGLQEQARVLAEFAATQLKLTDPVVAVVHPQEDGMAEVADAAVAGLRQRGWNRSVAVHYPAGRMPARDLVAKLQQSGVQVLIFLGSDAEMEQLGTSIRDAIWTPYLLAPGVRVGRAAVNLPTTLGNRIFLAYPTRPADITSAGAATLGAFQRGAGLGARHQPAQASTYASLLVLEEALKRAGRDLSRAKLINALENLFSFETTVTPALSYGPNRRIGAMGGYVVTVDPGSHSLKPASAYIRIE
ncbi:Cytochrome c domain-containing protein [Rubrivivax sp. A210]|uniref:cytochrome c/ABC transporter substrate-binding protein n=1 Tax=Rubrivivax sp. A210 TaxID=2772301 RepID=UPI0019196573|nr:ABC transporter substrate-binding protein [Rubrivivax sp. A210]CAD5369818.1 Cytochrome c domain-containing protein [Rubrivivax sp. A210]